ncbi:MAG: hypothetical protein KC518_13175, partial [Candidatus Cloacimonetes bacterium]|nr:hypothetical protein [Candidatus Cloacimonadota bacterium]
LAAVPVISPSTGVFVHLSAFLFGAILSDLVHHVFVLRWSTGDHEFHLLAEGRSPTDLRAELAAFSASGALAYGLFWGALIEALTVYLRFGLQLQSQRETAFLASFTCGLRVHHGYLGLMMILCSILLSSTASWKSNALAIVGWALLSSDLVHHFVVLQMLTGDPQFHLTY